MPRSLLPFAPLAAALLLAACSKPAESPPPAAAATTIAAPPAAPADHGIAWKAASSDAEVDAAFALARDEGKPVFVYWGAKWCPPCNQVKATLFNRQDFIERSRAFVPVYVDGDSPGAQKIGARFKVRGYPTMVLFDKHGTELTRLPGEVDAAQYTQVLTLGMNAQRPVKAVLAQARNGGAGLDANDWRLLAYYSWETDQQQIVKADEVPALLKQLAAACPADQADTASRLTLKSLAALELPPGAKPAADAAARATLTQVLADPAQRRTHMDLLTNNAAPLVRATSAAGSPERAALLAGFDSALKALEADSTLSRADRMTALIARTNLARVDAPQAEAAKVKLPDSLLADLRNVSARFDAEIGDGYERQAVITTAAYALEHAGLMAESDALLKANLAKSHSPYYLMIDLADNARKRGDKAEALRWYEQAFDRSEGPATRLQWGAGYVGALVELSPNDDARIEAAVRKLFDEAAAMPDAFYERSGRSLERIAKQLQTWNRDGRKAAAVERLRWQLDGICAKKPKDDAQRDECEKLMKPMGLRKAG